MASFRICNFLGLFLLTVTYAAEGSYNQNKKRDADKCVDQAICASQDDICSSSDQTLALKLCPVKCGLCVPGCSDSPKVNCSDIAADVCTFDSAFLLCPVTCNLCDKDPLTHPCRDHVQNIACQDLPDPCSDTVGMITCPRHCGLCADQTSTAPMTSAFPITYPVVTATTKSPTTPIPVTTPILTTNTPLPQTTARPTAALPLPLSVSGPCDVNPCQNGGSCLETGTNMFTCACPHGFEGAFCDNQLTPADDHCAFNPCYNGGTCHVTGADFYCECPSEYLGQVCEQRATTVPTTTTTQDPLPHACPFNPCRHGGYCVATGPDYGCFCPAGISGILCDDVISPTSLVADICPFNPCSNGGYCVSAGEDFKCYCPKTHTGKICDDLVLPPTSPTTTTTTTTRRTTTAIPACKIDLQLLLDSSGSVGRRNFGTMLDFTIKLVMNLDSHHHDVRVGLAVYSSNIYPSFYLNTYSSVSSIAAQISQTPYHNGNTDTEDALMFVRQHAFTANRGDRANVQNVVIIIADGQSSHPRLAIDQAQNLKDDGVKIIAIGVGNSVDRNELNLIATDATHVFTVSDYDALKNVENDLLLMTCLNSYQPMAIG